MDYELLHGLERHFLNLEELGAHDKEFNIMLKLGNGICWALKFRHAGLIYNRLDLVLADCIACDGTLTIRDVATFHHMMIGETTFDEELKHDRMKLQTSSPEIAHALKARFHGVLSTTSSAMYSNTTAPSSSSAAVGSSSSSAAYPSSSSSSTAAAPSSSSAAHQPGGVSSGNSSSNNANNNNPSSSMRDYRVTSSGEAPPLKTGWLLKKRDIISGWKCRYFEVHMDRLDYFESPDDARPRGSYLLHHVDVSTVKPIRTKRKSEHYGLFLQLHAPEKTIKLASDKTGLEGRVEADAWYQVFTMIARHHKARAAGGVTSSNNANGGSSQVAPPPPPPPEFSNSPGGQRLTPKRVAYTPATTATENSWSSSRPTAIATTTATTASSSKKTIGHKFARFVRRITGRKPTTTSGRRSRGGGVHARSGSSSGGNTPTGASGLTLRGKKKSLAKMNSTAVGNDGIAVAGGDGNDGTGPSMAGAVGAGKSGMARSGIRSAGDTVGATQILAYGGGILALTVALVYAWWVTKTISTKTFVTLAVLMVVLMAIFVQEFILDDDDDEEDEEEEDGEEEDGEYEGEEVDEAGDFADGEGGDRHDSFDHGDDDDHDGERRRRTAPAATNEIGGEDDEEEEDLDTDDEDDVHSDEEAYAAAKARPPKGAHRPPPVPSGV